MQLFLRSLLLSLLTSAASHGQGPSIDPAFAIGQVYAPATLRQAVQQPDGKRVLLGTFSRVAGTDVAVAGTYTLARLLAGGTQPDAAFQANVAGLQGEITQVLPLANGQLLVLGQGRAYPLQLGSVTRLGLLRLNTDGTADPGFDLGTAVPSLAPKAVAEQPDGKLVVAGFFEAANGALSPALVRLNANGTTDATFQPAQAGALDAYPEQVLQQADGKVIIGGAFTTVQGQPRRALARLLPTGALDASFNAVLPAGTTAGGLALQADGNLLALLGGNGSRTLRRLLPTGAPDPTWQPGTGFGSTNVRFFGPLAIQADGRILVSTSATSYNGSPIGRLVRLLPSGTLDTSFANQTAAPDAERYAYSLQALSNGEVLAAGLAQPYGAAGTAPVALAVLASSGTYLPAAAPAVQRPGRVLDLAQLPNGQVLAGGDFNEINGLAAGYVARLNANGTPDATFVGTCNGPVHSVVLQPDGKVLLGGRFGYAAGAARAGLARLLASGTLDAAFAPTLQPVDGGSQVRQVALQADGKVLLSGSFNLRPNATASPQVLARVLGTTGQRDPAFVPADSTGNFTLLVQPDGRILVGGQSRQLVPGATAPVPVWRLLASGALDFSFQLTPVVARGNFVNSQETTVLALDAAGRVYVGGRFASFGAVPTRDVARLLPTGAPDASFVVGLSGTTYSIDALTVQPNGRVLAGAEVFRAGGAATGLVRLLASGSEDPSFQPASGPGPGVFRLLIQPNGAIVAGGAFQQVGSLPLLGLTRLLDANVLAVTPRQSAAGLDAWPVPAHGTLHLRADATARPQRVRLLDALGRAVLAQAMTGPDEALNVSAVSPGVYFVQVEYATGLSSVKRVVID